MSEKVADNDSIRQQILNHVQRLRAAGVEWAPDAPSLAVSRQPLVDMPLVLQRNLLPGKNEGPAPSANGLSLEQRRQGLQVLAQEVKGCTRCAELCSTRTQTVFGDGSAGAELCFIGEAPGADEDAQGVPFVGPAGQLLTRIITGGLGMKRSDVYICNILRCRPPGNRLPLANEAANCRSFLERQLELVQPKYICALGACAAQNLLQTTLSVGKLRGRFHDYRGVPVLVTYHPSYLLRCQEPKRSEEKRKVWEDMKQLLARMGKPVPGRQPADG
jgi:DNA polymerase